MSAQNVSYEQLAMYMTPEEVKRNFRVRESEYDEHDMTFMEEHLYNRKKEEAKETNIGGWPRKKGEQSLYSHIQKHGVREPIRVDAETKEIWDGHHRIASAPDKSLIPIEYRSE